MKNESRTPYTKNIFCKKVKPVIDENTRIKLLTRLS